ncbi:hypothetical protein APE_2185.1 [Aeropyrum pernix K1]|uniref:Uncharacterized protein n=1 Tax=Aeropyrum pernix (strain ATCC 700893 / DSM 11879 / JCM 9820 / NBRC 100138 / K1) TaxID=272557 RepID=Q9Y9V4_AERPE|nr:hypothetical protein [Aeropyrum pernix]BAA81196.2 hypothetical protein APE_2185.1 [Aeropyrum pernix K1]
MSEEVEREEEAVAEEETGSLELVTEEAGAEEAVEEAEEAEEEVAYVFDITKPELIDVMLKVADTLEAVARGEATVSEALAFLSTEGIEEVLLQTRKPVKKRAKSRAKKKEKKKAVAQKTKSKSKKASGGKSKSKSKSSKSKKSSK